MNTAKTIYIYRETKKQLTELIIKVIIRTSSLYTRKYLTACQQDVFATGL